MSSARCSAAACSIRSTRRGRCCASIATSPRPDLMSSARRWAESARWKAFLLSAVAGCYSGSLEDGEKALAPLRGFGSPVADLFGPISYLQMQSMFDPWFPPGRQAYWKANFLRGLPDEAIEVFHHYALTVPSPYTTGPWLENMHGAVSRVAPTETAFAHRQHPYNFLVLVELGRTVRSRAECPVDAGVLGCDASVHGSRRLCQLSRRGGGPSCTLLPMAPTMIGSWP